MARAVAAGYVTHAAANKRRFAWLFAGYLLGFELVGAFALTVLLLLVDREHTILVDPAGYALRYGVPVAAVAVLLFVRYYRGHAAYVEHALDVRIVERRDEPRFVALAESSCTALGVRAPRFGVIEVAEANALTVGQGPARGLIAVTRGLLDRLDDDELAAVLAHEASHIRQGDTRVLAANHALMRAAVLFQTHNLLRLDDWRVLLLPIIVPPMLVLMLGGGAATEWAMRYARWAQRGVRLSRDHVADGEAVRVTHDPDALLSALEKVGGRGVFRGSWRVDALLFDGQADHQGGSHPAVADRRAAIASLGAEMMGSGRTRRDTRVARPAVRGAFGRRGGIVVAPPPAARVAVPEGRFHFAVDAEGRPLEQPPTPTAELMWLMIADRAAYRRWTDGLTAWHEWRASDRRNALGLTPKMLLPVAAVAVFLGVFHWPADHDPVAFARVFDPKGAAGWFGQMADFIAPCSANGVDTAAGCGVAPMPRPGAPVETNDDALMVMPLFFAGLIGLAIFKPRALEQLFGVRKERR